MPSWVLNTLNAWPWVIGFLWDAFAPIRVLLLAAQNPCHVHLIVPRFRYVTKVARQTLRKIKYRKFQILNFVRNNQLTVFYHSDSRILYGGATVVTVVYWRLHEYNHYQINSRTCYEQSKQFWSSTTSSHCKLNWLTHSKTNKNRKAKKMTTLQGYHHL